MQSSAISPDAYMNELPEDRKAAISKLRDILNTHLPQGFEETMASGMISYVVPFHIYPQGYHCKPKQPLPFIGIASQKNFIAIYHLGFYVDQDLLTWFKENYTLQTTAKLDMGKSCIRFKKSSDIPYNLIELLAKKITPAQWIETYEAGRQSLKAE